MGIGYFLRLGDRTTCGGQIVTGCDSHLIDGLPAARVGDKYICGKDGNQYFIVSGIPDTTIMDLPAAGTEHSIGSCSCNCKFIASCLTDIYGFKSEYYEKPRAAKPVQPIRPMQPEPASAPGPGPVAKSQEEPRIPVDAGFCVLPFGTTPSLYKPWFFINSEEDVLSLYDEMNPEKEKKPGSILILVDPLKKESDQIEHLKKARDTVDAALEPLTNAEALFLYKHRNVIDQFSSIGGDYGGFLSGMAKEYFSEIEKTLTSIQQTYQNQFITHGTLISEQFFIERNQLFKKLDSIFLKVFRERIGLAPYSDIKSALRLSSSSIIHRWNQTGVNDIEGYATYMERSAKVVKLMDGMGKVAVGLSALSGANTIYDACTTGINCSKTAFTEIGKFSGGILLPVLATGLVRTGTTAICAVILGAATAPAGGGGALACGVVVSGLSELAVGKIGESIGSSAGEVFYNFSN